MSPRAPHFSDAEAEGGDEAEARLDAELAETEHVVDARLAQLLAAPADRHTRTVADVSEGLLATSLWATTVDLLGTGWRTIRLLSSEPQPHESEHSS